MTSPARDPASPESGWARPAAALALGACALLVALVGLRALLLAGEYYDAYEVRAAARAILEGTGERWFPVHRSPLVGWVALAGEATGPGAGWLAPALLAAASYAACATLVGGAVRAWGARPWVASAAALLVVLDRLAFGYGAHGMHNVPEAAAVALVLYLVARDPGPFPARPALLGLAVGVAALARQNAGLVGLALLAGLPRAPAGDGRRLRDLPLTRLAAAGLVALLVYGLLSTAWFALAKGSLAGGLATHREFFTFYEAQLAESRQRYGPHTPTLFGLRALAVSSPWLVLLAPLGALGAARSGRPVGRVAVAWVLLHVVFSTVAVSHGEARYLLPALPGLAVLAGIALEGAAERVERLGRWAPAALVLGLLAGALALGAPFEARHALDPVSRASFPARVAATAREAAGPDATFVYTTTHPYPVAPDVVVAEGTPYRGDPFHGIYHLGPVVLGYHLERPVVMLQGAGGGLRDPAALRAFARQAGLAPGDVLLVGLATPSATWDVEGAPPPPFGIGRVVAGAEGVDVVLDWVEQP